MEFINSIPLRYMEPVTVVLGLAAIIGTGALTKIGENMTDRSPQAVNKLFSWMKQRLPQSKMVAALQAGQEVDYQQAVMELEQILAETEGEKLLAEVRSAVEANRGLQVQLEKAIDKIQSQPQYVQNNHNQAQGIQINGHGKLEAQNIGGNHNHYYGVKPD
jgi:capsid protein